MIACLSLAEHQQHSTAQQQHLQQARVGDERRVQQHVQRQVLGHGRGEHPEGQHTCVRGGSEAAADLRREWCSDAAAVDMRNNANGLC